MYISNKVLSDILRNCLKICLNNEKLELSDLSFAKKSLLYENEKIINNIYDNIFDCYWNEYYNHKEKKKRGKK